MDATHLAYVSDQTTEIVFSLRVQPLCIWRREGLT